MPSATQPMRILISPSGFKESLDPGLAADCIEEGLLRVLPDAIIRKAPLVDGGEGFTRGLVAVTNGHLHTISVTGPVGEPVDSFYGFTGTGNDNAVIEMAAAAGLRLVPRDARDPGVTTTYGVGELLVKVLDEGAKDILVGCGDSGTCDGGAGMLQALGGRLIDAEGNELPEASGGQDLARVADIDLTGLHPRLREAKIQVACNWDNVLCGDKGVARVFGPQKGASEEQVESLAAALDTWAAVVKEKLDIDIASAGGSGASGGLGAGLLIIGATLHPRFDLIMDYINLDRLMEDCDLVITAEGGIDKQTPNGKVPAEVAKHAKEHNLPVIALAGKIGTGAGANYSAGIDAYASIMQKPISLVDAIEDAEALLKDSAESAIRMIMVGQQLSMDSDGSDSSD